MMDRVKQLETMAVIRLYARRLLAANEDDSRPSVAKYNYLESINRMSELVSDLETRS